MNIILENKSSKTLFINLNGRSIVLNPFGKNTCDVDGERVSMSLTTEDGYTSEKNAEKLGYYCGHRFVTVSQYDFKPENDLAIELYVEMKKGDRFEAYQRVLPYCEGFTFPEPIYILKDEQNVKEKLAANERLMKKADKRAVLLVGADRIGTFVSNAFLLLLSVGLAAITFMGIWSNFSLKAAIITFVAIALIVWLVLSVVKKLVNGVGKAAVRFFDSKLFDKTMDKANEKFEEKYVYCKGMPEGLYKDESSFFDPNYISAVFKYSNKNI